LVILTVELESSKDKNFSPLPEEHWTENNMKTFLVNIAKSFGLDPLVPETWYKIPARSIYLSKVYTVV
jgi:hypothetical protein